MKNLFAILFLFVPLIASATNYYVKNGGSDAAAGTSDATAWASVEKVTAASYGTFQAGDSVLFNRGDVWRTRLFIDDAGTAAAYLVYSAYGTGAKPLFLGSVTANSTGDWTEVSANIWQNSKAAFVIDVANLIFNNEESCGVKIMSATPTLDAQGEFWYDFVNDRIRLYSVGNPATFYTSIECVLKDYAIFVYNSKYAIIENLDVRYANFGILIQGYPDPTNISHHIIVRDCDVSYTGGGDQWNDYTVRLGDAISLNDNVNNILVERCHISQGYDAGLTNQASTNGHTQYNIYFRNNIVEKCDMTLSPMIRGTGSSMDSIYYENNTVVNSGEGWGHNQRPDGPFGHAFVVFCNQNGATSTNVFIRNNIFYKATGNIINYSCLADLSGYTINNNVLYQSSGNIGKIGVTSYATLADWRTASGKDANSVSSDPLFVSASDFHLQAGSPAINAGVDIGLTTDYSGNRITGLPDIGAYDRGTRYLKIGGKLQTINGKLSTILQ